MSQRWNATLSGKRDILAVRARMVQSIRNYFISRDYLEVETPNRIPALIPEPYIDAVASGEWFLHTSPEVCMKRLVAAGYRRIFQICKCYREGERGSRHLAEFTLLEWYCEGVDYYSLMDQCEEMIIAVARDLGYGDVVHYHGNTISLSGAWGRISVADVLARYARMSIEEAIHGDCFDEVMVCSVEPHLGIDRPTFVYDYPLSSGVLAKEKDMDPLTAERFELYMGGMEIANGFSELVDLEEHHRRFREVREYRRSTGKKVFPEPAHFLSDLVTMPDSAGVALGVDRLAMIFTDSPVIDDVVAFTPEMV
ncbi:MAG: EF-P lysine aminoacylase GenX [Deltaproteobacteria bacterium]|nr:EF-P lysine aminoacylase GenX [Deltaproteobacteria bacterium]